MPIPSSHREILLVHGEEWALMLSLSGKHAAQWAVVVLFHGGILMVHSKEWVPVFVTVMEGSFMCLPRNKFLCLSPSWRDLPRANQGMSFCVVTPMGWSCGMSDCFVTVVEGSCRLSCCVLPAMEGSGLCTVSSKPLLCCHCCQCHWGILLVCSEEWAVVLSLS